MKEEYEYVQRALYTYDDTEEMLKVGLPMMSYSLIMTSFFSAGDPGHRGRHS